MNFKWDFLLYFGVFAVDFLLLFVTTGADVNTDEEPNAPVFIILILLIHCVRPQLTEFIELPVLRIDVSLSDEFVTVVVVSGVS